MNSCINDVAWHWITKCWLSLVPSRVDASTHAEGLQVSYGGVIDGIMSLVINPLCFIIKNK